MNNAGKNPILFLSPKERYYIIPAHISQHQIATALSAYKLERLSYTSRPFDIYDTFDGRLAAAHTALLKMENVFYFIDRKSGSYLEASKDLSQQYYYWQDFSGRLHAMLQRKAASRALYAQLEIQVKRSTMRLVNDDDKTVQICHFIRLVIAGRSKKRTIKLIHAVPLKGYSDDLRWVEVQLRAMGMNEIQGSLVDLCLDESELRLHKKFKPTLNQNQASWKAAQTLLQILNGTMQAHREGVVKDIDTEFLHDFRVALRRTRTALDQLECVLPQSEAVHFKAEFKSLQRATNRLRDLDVHLLNRSAYEEALPTSLRSGLVRFFQALSKSRHQEFDRVRRLFDSAEFDALMEQWAIFLCADWQRQESLTLQNAPIKALSDQLLNDGLSEILIEAAKITTDTPGKQIHKIRIRCKNFRYTCEFFHSLYPDEMKKVISQFKELQDYLGRLHDLSIQQKRIIKFMRKLQPDADNQTIAALGGLVVVLTREFEKLRCQIRSRFDTFSRHVSSSFHV
ncbi:CHAD domain-containing protein [candidate division KSB1 bacterium]|nr:CHAD domain-containing protein [candidate division KSB1 bacterium]RQW04339.1 MAG: CHAD domain-containing protein [candidate division KSB1 bacterium]